MLRTHTTEYREDRKRPKPNPPVEQESAPSALGATRPCHQAARREREAAQLAMEHAAVKTDEQSAAGELQAEQEAHRCVRSGCNSGDRCRS